MVRTWFAISIIILASSPSRSQVELDIQPYIFKTNKGDSIHAEIGKFNVPENRTKAESRKLNLKFIRFKSTSKSPGYPIVYLAGGPGGSGINAAKGDRIKLFQELRKIGDVIAFDQRGTGISDGPPPYAGWWSFDPDKPTDREVVEKKIFEETLRAAKYFESQGVDLSGYNTNENADDLNDLRIALGAEKISLVSISYGTHLALTTLKRHEKVINKIVLAGVEGYDHTIKLPSDQQKLLEEIDRRLKTNPKYVQVFPNFLIDLEEVLKIADEKPILTQTRNPMTGQTMDIKLGKFDLQMIFSWTLRGPDSFKGLPLLIKQILSSDYSGLYDYALYTHIGRFRGMNMGMDVASGISSQRYYRVNEEKNNTLLGDAINFPLLVQMNALKQLDLGEGFRNPYPSSVPVLCISGTLDGRTPPGNAEETLEYFDNGEHLIIDGAGHGDDLFLSSPMILKNITGFFLDHELSFEKITLEPVEFDLPEKLKE